MDEAYRVTLHCHRGQKAHPALTGRETRRPRQLGTLNRASKLAGFRLLTVCRASRSGCWMRGLCSQSLACCPPHAPSLSGRLRCCWASLPPQTPTSRPRSCSGGPCLRSSRCSATRTCSSRRWPPLRWAGWPRMQRTRRALCRCVHQALASVPPLTCTAACQCKRPGTVKFIYTLTVLIIEMQQGCKGWPAQTAACLARSQSALHLPDPWRSMSSAWSSVTRRLPLTASRVEPFYAPNIARLPLAQSSALVHIDGC